MQTLIALAAFLLTLGILVSFHEFGHIFTCACFYVTSLAFGAKAPFVDHLIVVPLIMFIALIPITIAGAGTRDAASIYFFSLVGVSKAIALSLSLINLASSILISLIGGIFYVGVYHNMVQNKALHPVPVKTV